MPANYVLLEKIVVGAAGATSVTFNSIPQTGYTDLVVRMSARDGSSNGTIYLSINGTTQTNQTMKRLEGNGASATSDSQSSIYFTMDYASHTANTFGNAEMYIPNYTSSNYKSISIDAIEENNATTAFSNLVAGLWSNTAAITSLNFQCNASFAQYSTFYLYGVAKLGTSPTIAPKATGGDTIMTDGTYWYHAFKSSGTFTPASAMSCDVLVVAGGGGGSGPGAGGGAGGVLAFASQSVSSATTVTVGAGGTTNTNGVNSQFASLTAADGGGSASSLSSGNGNAGGSGGGGNGGTTGTVVSTGGAPTSGQGNAGGTGLAPNNNAGGGGGAGSAGANGTVGSGGNGGAGTNSVTNWGALSTVLTTTGLGVSGFIAGGGGGYAGGSGGSGGGGNWGGPGLAATPNTGSGGGGYSGNGGSGLVIVRYTV